MSITFTESVLRTSQAKEAIFEGIITALFTGDLEKGWNAMIQKGRKNGAYLAVKTAFVLDFLKALKSQ